MRTKIELVCPAGNAPALRAAVDAGADAVYIGFTDGTNARNFPGLNFEPATAIEGIQYAREHNTKILLALNTFPRPDQWSRWTDAVQRAVDIGADALILADPGLMAYTTKNFPGTRIHLSVQASATNYAAINFYYHQFNIKRVVLPRVLSLSQVRNLIKHCPIPVEVFGFGSLCVMVEGRCALSSYVTGQSPNSSGVCSPANAVRWEEDGNQRSTRLNGVLIDQYKADEPAGYPTLCKGRFNVSGHTFYALEEPTSLNVLESLPELNAMGIRAIKVEGRQRSPAYVGRVTAIMRAAIDRYHKDPDGYEVASEWTSALNTVAEGQCHTLGALHREWH